MTTDERNEFGLDAYFEAAQEVATQPSNALLGRIMVDADAQMAGGPVPAPIKKPRLLAVLWSAIGGWPAAAGMVTATLVGVWIGFSQPAGLDLLADRYLGLEEDRYLVDLVPAFGDDLGEG